MCERHEEGSAVGGRGHREPRAGGEVGEGGAGEPVVEARDVGGGQKHGSRVTVECADRSVPIGD
jgi:hypothetical protein